jgi:hypothetical protein
MPNSVDEEVFSTLLEGKNDDKNNNLVELKK